MDLPRLPSRLSICFDMLAALLVFLGPYAVRWAVGIQIMLATVQTVTSF